MPSLQTLPSTYEAIRFQARLTPHAVAIASPARDIEYREFARDIESVTRRLHHMALEPGRVAVLVLNPYLRWLVLISLGRLGLVSVSLGEPVKELAFVRPRYVITDQAGQFSGRDIIMADPSWTDADAHALPAFKDKRFDPSTPCRMVLSSGTTGVPKKAVLTYGDLRDRITSNARAYGLNATARILTTMGSTTIGGYMTYLACWANGGTAILLELAAHTSLPRMLGMRPNVLLTSTAQLETLMKTLPADYWPSRHLYLYVAGSMLPPALSRAVRSRLTQFLFVIYGSTEAGSVTLTHALRAEQQPGFTGYVLPTAEVEVVGDDGLPVESGQPGDLRIRSNGMVAGYVDEPAGADPAFRDGWFYPGDLGAFTPDGGLVLLGRTREVMNFGGMKHAPDALEHALAEFPGMKDFAVFALGGSGHERPWLAVVPEQDFSDEALQAHFKKAFPSLPRVSVARVHAIPRNEMGKVMRHELRKRVEKAIADSAAQEARPRTGITQPS